MILYRKLHKLISLKSGVESDLIFWEYVLYQFGLKGFGRVHDLQNDLTAVMMSGPIVSRFL